MLYSLEQGPTEQTIIRQAAQQRLPIPDRILNKPTLLKGLELYLQAFMDLNNSRQMGPSGEGPVSWEAVLKYCQYYDLDTEQTEDMLYHVQCMDSIYLSHRAKQTAKAAKAKAPAKGVRK